MGPPIVQVSFIERSNIQCPFLFMEGSTVLLVYSHMLQQNPPQSHFRGFQVGCGTAKITHANIIDHNTVQRYSP